MLQKYGSFKIFPTIDVSRNSIISFFPLNGTSIMKKSLTDVFALSLFLPSNGFSNFSQRHQFYAISEL